MQRIKIFLAILFSIVSVAGAEALNKEPLLKMYNDLWSQGITAQQQGNYQSSIWYFRKSPAIREKALGRKYADTYESFHSKSSHYYLKEDYPKALEYCQKALAIQEKVLGKGHIDTAISYGNLGLLYQRIGDYPKALEYSRKALAIRGKVLGKEHIDTAISYNNLGSLYQDMGDYPKALKYYQKALAIQEKVLGEGHIDTALSYNNMSSLYYTRTGYRKALEYSHKALAITKKVRGKEHIDTALSYRNLGWVYYNIGDYPKALKYYQRALTIREKVLGKEHVGTATSYNDLILVYRMMGDYPNAHHYAKLSFDIFLKNRDKIFTILNSRQKERYLKANTGYAALLLDSSSKYLSRLNQEKKSTKVKEVTATVLNAWLNYKGSIFDSENAIAMLYANTKDAPLKRKINEFLSSKRTLAKLYQSLPKPKERDAWKTKIKTIEAKIAQLTSQIASKATSFKEQQGLKSINYKDISSHLKANELYIDYAKIGRHYYLFSLDNKEHIDFYEMYGYSIFLIEKLVRTFRDDVTAILSNTQITDEKLKSLTQSSKEKLSKLYELVIEKPLGDALKRKTSLILSPDGALRLLPFEALYNKETGKYFIEEKEIRYIPSGKELVRLYRYSKDKPAKSVSVIFANPNFNAKITSLSKEQIAITPNTSRSGIIKSLFRMRFSPLPGTKAEAKAIKATLQKDTVSEYQKEKASETNLIKVKEPKILHIATHGFFINDNTIPNPMLKSGIALAGANNSAIRGKSDGIVTALKLSGLKLKGTDLVVLSACETGVVDIDATDSVSGLSKAFIQAGAKDIVMSLWSVDDQATKELMSSFYQEMTQNTGYAKALKAAKLRMIKENRHPFFWAAFVVSGL